MLEKWLGAEDQHTSTTLAVEGTYIYDALVSIPRSSVPKRTAVTDCELQDANSI